MLEQMSGHDWPCQMDTWKLTITSLLKMKALVPQLLVGWGADSSELSPSPGTALSLRELPCPRSHLALPAQGMSRYKDQPPLRHVGTILKGHPWYWAPHGIHWGVCCIPAPLLFLLTLLPLQVSPDGTLNQPPAHRSPFQSLSPDTGVSKL